MNIASSKQNAQDRITQQWVILTGKQIDKDHYSWLLGPFGNTNGIGRKFINELAEKEHLTIDESTVQRGLLGSIDELGLSENEVARLSEQVKDFYVNTAAYTLDLKVKWNPVFRVFGILLKFIFSRRIQQLNIPTKNNSNSRSLSSEVILLRDKVSGEVKRTIWLRAYKDNNEVVYSGIYGSTVLPSGKRNVKAVFPLPNGNATVLLAPSVGNKGELILESSGKNLGDSGFYFLLNDSKGKLWTRYIRSFKDTLTVSEVNDRLMAVQIMRLWNVRVVSFEYEIRKRPRVTFVVES